jgi:hypothetical protein
MGGGGGQQETKTEIAPEFKPYITYSLGEAQRLYQGMPQAPATLAPEQSAFSQAAIQQAAQRAQMGSPLVGAAQAEQLATIQGRGVNPFLAGALEQSNRLAREQFTEGVQGLQSKASSMVAMDLVLWQNKKLALKTYLLALWLNKAVSWLINRLRLKELDKCKLLRLLRLWLLLTMQIFSVYCKQVRLKRAMHNKHCKVNWLLRIFRCKDYNRLLMSSMALH